MNFPGSGLLGSLKAMFAGPVALTLTIVMTVILGIVMSKGDHESKSRVGPWFFGSFIAMTASVIATWFQSQS